MNPAPPVTTILVGSRVYPSDRFSGSHHQRLSRYHSTVSSSASSSVRGARQPSAVILAMSTE